MRRARGDQSIPPKRRWPDLAHRVNASRVERARTEVPTRERRLWFALTHALRDDRPGEALGPLLGALGSVVDVGDRLDWLAYEMATRAILALVSQAEVVRKEVLSWHAWRQGSRDPASSRVAFLDIALAVKVHAHLFSRREEWITHRGPAAAEVMRVALVHQFGPSIPRADRLREWLGDLVEGRLAASGVVARIVHEGGLFGTNKATRLNTTIRRVDNALSGRTKKTDKNAKRRRKRPIPRS